MVDVNTILSLAVPLVVAGSWAKYKGLEHILINYRWIFVCFFLMPISLIYDTYMYLRCWFIFRISSAPEKHEEKVRDVQRQVSSPSPGRRSARHRPGFGAGRGRRPARSNS